MTARRATATAVCATLVLASAAQASPTATSISATNGHTCASLSGGAVACWGESYLPRTISNAPVRLPTLSGVRSVSASIRYNCALQSAGTIACWGDDGYGQLGNGSTQDSGRPVQVSGIGNAVAVSAGGFHACALLATGAVRCWGRNLRGALGDGSKADSSVPVAVSRITDAVAISAGYLLDETCAVLRSGRVLCWGANTRGQLGDGTRRASTVPVAVKGISDAVSVAAGGLHACAVLSTGAIDCWGANDVGQLGNGTTRDSSTPVAVRGIAGAQSVSVAARAYSCALLASGAVYCWGSNHKDQLGDGRQPAGSSTPVRVLGVAHAVSITAAIGHACALLDSGGADCWGYDDYGQLGDGGLLPRVRNASPVAFGGG